MKEGELDCLKTFIYFLSLKFSSFIVLEGLLLNSSADIEQQRFIIKLRKLQLSTQTLKSFQQ